MVVLGIVGLIAGFVLPWIKGIFSLEKQSRDQLSSLAEQRIEENYIRNQLSNSSIMRSKLITCKKNHLLMLNETPSVSPRLFSKSGNSIDFVSSKALGIGTVVNNSLVVTYSGDFVPGSLLYLRSVNGDNKEFIVRIQSVASSSTSFSKKLGFDYKLTAPPLFTSCSFENPQDIQSYMNSFEKKRFSVELISFNQLSLSNQNNMMALYFKTWPQIGFLRAALEGNKYILKNTDITNSKVYDSIDSLSVEENFDGAKSSISGNYSVKISFRSVKIKTVQDENVGVAGASVSTHVIFGAYSIVGLEIGNIKSGTAIVVKPPKVTCSVIYKRINNGPLNTGTALYEIKILFSEATSINTATNPLNALINIRSPSATDNMIKCYRHNQYSASAQSFVGDSFEGEVSLSATGGATSTDPIYCYLQSESVVSGKLTYLAITGSSAQQYSPTCESVDLSI